MDRWFPDFNSRTTWHQTLDGHLGNLETSKHVHAEHETSGEVYIARARAILYGCSIILIMIQISPDNSEVRSASKRDLIGYDVVRQVLM
jgi:hypothetical protein